MEKDYIHEAVEIADGWAIHGMTVANDEHQFGWYSDERLNQAWKDALAAQLVRQVDALAPDVVFNCGFGGEVMVYRESTDEDWTEGYGNDGSNDRTMNTIRAIVDSAVLQRQTEDQ